MLLNNLSQENKLRLIDHLLERMLDEEPDMALNYVLAVNSVTKNLREELLSFDEIVLLEDLCSSFIPS